MSSCDGNRMRNSESLDFPMKSESEDSSSLSAIKLENNDLVCNESLLVDGSLFMNPDMEFKTEPETFESSDSDMKYCYDDDASVSEEDLQSCKKEVDKEDESVKTYLWSEIGLKEECGKGEVSEQVNQIEEKIENSECDKYLCPENDPRTDTDVGMREKSFLPGNHRKQFSDIVNSNNHKLIHTGGQFGCRECGKTFYNQDDLEAHYETHTRRKSFQCSECGKVFLQKCVLIAHLRIHSGEKPFKCSVCDKAFSQKISLTTHFRIHTGEKPFKCGVCDKAFSQKCKLTLHSRTHTGEKPFKCNVCDKAFSQRSLLTRHFKTHTGEKPFKCSNCQMAFARRFCLSNHMKICAGENV